MLILRRSGAIMIAIYALANDIRAIEAHIALRRQSIPCCLIGPEYRHASVVHKVPFVFVGEGCETVVDGFLHPIPDGKLIRSHHMLCADRLIQHLKDVYNRDFANLFCGGIRFEEDQFYFYGNRIRLTDYETMIVKHLALCRGCCFTAEEITAFCLSGGSSAAVHVCNINAKNRASVTEKIVYSKRYQGYYIK